MAHRTHAASSAMSQQSQLEPTTCCSPLTYPFSPPAGTYRLPARAHAEKETTFHCFDGCSPTHAKRIKYKNSGSATTIEDISFLEGGVLVTKASNSAHILPYPCLLVLTCVMPLQIAASKDKKYILRMSFIGMRETVVRSVQTDHAACRRAIFTLCKPCRLVLMAFKPRKSDHWACFSAN
jgi:hypothetical protein